MYSIVHLIISDLNDTQTIQTWLDANPSIKIDAVVYQNCDVYIYYS